MIDTHTKKAGPSSVLSGSIVEDDLVLTTVELCRACHADEAQIEVWVGEGVLTPIGESPGEWRFTGESLTRIRLATRLARDLELNSPGVALALDLLDRIDALEARLRRESAGRLRP